MDALFTAFVHAIYILAGIGFISLILSLWLDNR